LPDEAPHILNTISRLKLQLSDFIDPDFGLLDILLSKEVLSHRQHANVRSGVTVYDRVDSLLESLTTEDQCNKFLEALRQSSQTHVVNYITQNGGQKCNFYAPPSWDCSCPCRG